MRTVVTSCWLVTVMWSSAAWAGPILAESETNNSFNDANVIPGAALPAAAIKASLGPDGTPAGVDFFGFDVPASLPLVTASVFDCTPDAADNDSYVGIYRSYQSSGVLWDVNDDGNPGLLSSIHFKPGTSGRWAAAVTGLGDYFFQGQGHSQQFEYRMVVSTGASAVESEPNDTLASAQLLPASLFTAGAAAVEGSLVPDSTAGGIDFYAIEVEAGTLVTASVFDFTPDVPEDADGRLGVYGPDGTLFGYDESDGVGFLPAIHFYAPQTGRYTFALTGFYDFDFDGVGHSETFDYRLVFSVPEPGSALLLATGAGLAIRRHHRSAAEKAQEH